MLLLAQRHALAQTVVVFFSPFQLPSPPHCRESNSELLHHLSIAAPAQKMGTAEACAYLLGQVVQARVLTVDAAKARMQLSLDTAAAKPGATPTPTPAAAPSAAAAVDATPAPGDVVWGTVIASPKDALGPAFVPHACAPGYEAVYVAVKDGQNRSCGVGFIAAEHFADEVQASLVARAAVAPGAKLMCVWRRRHASARLLSWVGFVLG